MTETTPLFERLGGRDGIYAIARQLVDNHLENPAIASRYATASKSRDQLVAGAAEFFCTGLSGVETYEGASLVEVHTGMNVSDAEFVAVLDDAIDAMRKVGVGDLEQAEVLHILYGMKSEVVHL